MKTLYTLIAIAIFSFNVYSQVPKIPLIEHFTQASCGPCAQQNPVMYSTLNTFGSGNYNKITYQTSWPGVDPMNAEYPAAPADRVGYYGVIGVPDVSLNGGALAQPNTAVTSSTMNAAAALMTPYQINLNQTWGSGGDLTVTVSVVNTTGASINSANRLYLTMIEDHIHFNTAPGTNGETDFFYIARDMYNVSTGASTTGGLTIGAIPANDSLFYTVNIPSVPSYVRDLNEVSFVAFVQNNVSKEVHQSGKSAAGGAPGIAVSATSSSSTPSDYCDYSFVPSIDIFNDGLTPITDALVEYSVNGGIAISEVYSGSIASGLSGTITFPTIQLPSGVSTISYNVITVNGSSGFVSPSSAVIPDEEIIKLSLSSIGNSISEGFQGYALLTPNPTNVIAENPDDIRAWILDGSISPAITWNVGGHGLSDGCFRWDFWDIANGLSSRLLWDKHDLSNSINSKLSLDRAYAQYSSNTDDRLIVRVSVDCGVNWTAVYDKQGSQLATAPIHSNSRFYPTANEWVTDTIDISAYDGMDEILISFEGVSAYGNSLYIDNVNLFSIIPLPSVENTFSSLGQSTSCEDSLLVSVDFTNNGNVALSTMIVSSAINGGTPELIPLALGTPLPVGNTATITYWVTNPNNGLVNTVSSEFIDLNGYDNTANTQLSSIDFLSINSFQSNTNIGEFNIQFDDFTDQTTWTLTDQTLGINVISNVGQTFMPNTLYTDNFTLFENHCYSFELFDQNGLCCTQGAGYYDLSIDGISLSSGTFFQGMQENKFKFSLNPDASLDELIDNSFVVFPNPTNNLLNIKSTLLVENVSVSLLNNLGQIVKAERGLNFSNNSQVTLNITDLAPGAYWIRVVSNESVWSEKIVITK